MLRECDECFRGDAEMFCEECYGCEKCCRCNSDEFWVPTS